MREKFYEVHKRIYQGTRTTYEETNSSIKRQGTSDRLCLKRRLVPHSSQHAEKDDVRTDTITDQLPIISILLADASKYGTKLVFVDTKIAFLQALAFQRKVFVKTPQG